MEHLWPIVALVVGIMTHILKKAMKLNQQARMDAAEPPFDLSDYLTGHPYQTILTFIAGGGCYLALITSGPVSLSAAFLAGVAANSIGDIAPGQR